MEHVAGRIPVIAGTGANSTAEAIELMQYAKSVGAHGCLSVVPYYNRPTQEGLYQPLQGAGRGGRSADADVQRAGPHRGRHGQRHGTARGAGAGYRRPEGRDRQHRARFAS